METETHLEPHTRELMQVGRNILGKRKVENTSILGGI